MLEKTKKIKKDPLRIAKEAVGHNRMFNKAVTRPCKVVNNVSFNFDFGVDLDLDSYLCDLQRIRNSRCIEFYADNRNVAKMLNSRNILHFKRITKLLENNIEICKTRSSVRKITITGKNSYGAYLAIKKLLGN